MNKMTLECLAHLENEAFIRTSAIAFLMPLNLSMEDCMEIKTMLAEAVVNAMIHGYEGNHEGIVRVHVSYDENQIEIIVADEGCGIDDISQAMQPLFTSKQHLERSGKWQDNYATFAAMISLQAKRERTRRQHYVNRSNMNVSLIRRIDSKNQKMGMKQQKVFL